MGVKMENIVIGSGPAGRLASLELGKLGKDVTLIEKTTLQEPASMRAVWLSVH